MDTTVWFFCSKVLASSTHHTYRSGLNCSCKLCLEHNVAVSESVLGYFVASLGQQGDKIEICLAATRHAQIMQVYPASHESSSLLRLGLLQTGVKHVHVEQDMSPVHANFPMPPTPQSNGGMLHLKR